MVKLKPRQAIASSNQMAPAIVVAQPSQIQAV
jgi:hypothetical protein